MKNSNTKRILIFFGVLIMFSSLFNKAAKGLEQPDSEIICGGRIEKNYSAPKAIKSKDITSLETQFFSTEPFCKNRDSAFYGFELKKESNGVNLKEKLALGIESNFDDSLLIKVQEIIDKNNLAALNGNVSYTSGLPPQYRPCSLSITYASGEKLYFCTDDDSNRTWVSELLKLFIKVFAQKGYQEALPPKEETSIKFFHELTFYKGNLSYTYGEEIFPDEEDETNEEKNKILLNRQVWDWSANAPVSDEYAEIPKNFYKNLEKIIEDVELYDLLERYEIDLHNFKKNSKGYFILGLEYESKRQLFISIDKENELKDFELPPKKLTEYLDQLFK